MKKIFVLLLLPGVSKFIPVQDSTIQKLDALITAYASVGRFNGSVLIVQNNSPDFSPGEKST